MAVSTTARLYPLSTPDLIEMAADQGWLTHPRRFLTAYTAFGGIPRLWEDFLEKQNAGAIPEHDDQSDQVRQKNFIRWRVQAITGNIKESYFNTAFMNLSADPEKIIELIASNNNFVRRDALLELFKDEKTKEKKSTECLMHFRS